MSYKEQLQANNADLQVMLDTVDALPVVSDTSVAHVQANNVDLQAILGAVNSLPEQTTPMTSVAMNSASVVMYNKTTTFTATPGLQYIWVQGRAAEGYTSFSQNLAVAWFDGEAWHPMGGSSSITITDLTIKGSNSGGWSAGGGFAVQVNLVPSP